MLEKDNPKMPLKTQADLLGISYSSLFYEPVPPSARELAIKRCIDEIYTACPFYGSRKITTQMRPEFGVSRPTVQAYMREMGIFALVPGPHTSKPAPQHQIYPYLLRNVTATYPNHIWGIDITYIRLQHGWLYLTAVLDWYSRYVVSWALSQTLEMEFVLTAVDNALFQAKPEIWNSDQGSHFTSPKYLERLQREEIKISMDGRNIPPQIKNTGTFIPVFSRYSIPLTHFTLNGFNELTSRKSAVHKSISIHSAKAR
jgi:putative transposase